MTREGRATPREAIRLMDVLFTQKVNGTHMEGWSQPRIPVPALAVGTVLWLAWIAYCLIIIQQVLLGVLPVILFAVVYVGWRFLVALEAVADAQQRLASERERERDDA